MRAEPLVESDGLTIIRAQCRAGERIAGRHVHNEHSDAFYVLEGELTFEVGPEAEDVTVGAGGFVAVPPGVAHGFRTSGERPAAWLTIHAPDGGFAAFMRGRRSNGVEVDWDIADVPPDGGLPAALAVLRSARPRR
jgi:quercetin dioxygenase-like cupin family protein